MTRIVLDDRLLIEELLVGLRRRGRRNEFHTTMYWYYRACRAAIAGSGGHLSGPFERLPTEQQDAAVLSLLELRDDITLADALGTVPMMARLARAHPRLNVMNLEAVAAAHVLGATVWLSDRAARGVLPEVLDDEGIQWRTISVG